MKTNYSNFPQLKFKTVENFMAYNAKIRRRPQSSS